jgi:hypothetical protein
VTAFFFPNLPNFPANNRIYGFYKYFFLNRLLREPNQTTVIMGASQSHQLDSSPCLDLNCNTRPARKNRAERHVEQEKFEMLSADDFGQRLDGFICTPRKQAAHKLELSKVPAQLKPRSQIPAGFKDPEPIKGWTIDQQQILIKELRKNPKARKSADSLKEVFLTVQKSIPEKSRHEIEECYRHLQTKGIAYFSTRIRNG